MRDIRQDLAERLAEIAGRYHEVMSAYDEEREALDRKRATDIAALDRERDAVRQLLAIEQRREGIPPIAVDARSLVPLTDFLMAKVQAYGPIDKEALRQEARTAGYFDEGNGRAFHTTLLNITKHGKLIQLPDGKYRSPHADGRGLFHVSSKGQTVL